MTRKVQKNFRLDPVVIELLEAISKHHSEKDGTDFNMTKVVEYAVMELAKRDLGEEYVKDVLLKSYERNL